MVIIKWKLLVKVCSDGRFCCFELLLESEKSILWPYGYFVALGMTRILSFWVTDYWKWNFIDFSLHSKWQNSRHCKLVNQSAFTRRAKLPFFECFCVFTHRLKFAEFRHLHFDMREYAKILSKFLRLWRSKTYRA